VYLESAQDPGLCAAVNGGASITILLAAVLGLELPVTALAGALAQHGQLADHVPYHWAFEPKPQGLMVQPSPVRPAAAATQAGSGGCCWCSLFKLGACSFKRLLRGKAIRRRSGLGAPPWPFKPWCSPRWSTWSGISQVRAWALPFGRWAVGRGAFRQAPALLLGVKRWFAAPVSV